MREKAVLEQDMTSQNRPLAADHQELPWQRNVPVEHLEKMQEVRLALEGEQAESARLKAMIQQYERELEAIRNSTSWRLTAPLRALGMMRHHLLAIWHGGAGIKGLKSDPWITMRNLAGLVARNGLRGALNRLTLITHVRHSSQHGDGGYPQWVALYDTLSKEQRISFSSFVGQLENPPLFSIVMPVFDPPLAFLEAAIQSVRQQIYPHWELCIADDASRNPEVRTLIEGHTKVDQRIKVVFRERNGHISAASNSALSLAGGDFMALLDHDDVLKEDALLQMAVAINEHPQASLLFSDLDHLDANGQRIMPFFKPDWNESLFLSQNMVVHLGVYRMALVREIGGFRLGYEGAQDHDLALRVIEKLDPKDIIHIPRILYHHRIHPESTAASIEAKPYALEAGRKAIGDHLQRCGTQATVKVLEPGCYKVCYPLPEQPPLVSIIIPTKDGGELVERCLNSVFLKSTYPAFEVILVDNASTVPSSLAIFSRLKERYAGRLRIIQDPCTPFNFSAVNNHGVREARGELVCLLNNDTEVITPGWLDEMASLMLQKDVGVVGARLWYPDNTLQHGGIILGIGGVAGHAQKGLRRGIWGYYGRTGLRQDLSAVTGACLMTRKRLFEALGGLDEQNLGVAFNDVDYCLKVREAGLRVVYTPYAELYHHESLTRGYEDSPEKIARFKREERHMQQRWAHWLSCDPAYNPNLTLKREDFSLAWPPRRPFVLPGSEPAPGFLQATARSDGLLPGRG